MARSSPEKLAAALRANLKRRKQGGQNSPEPPGEPPGGDADSAPPEVPPDRAPRRPQD